MNILPGTIEEAKNLIYDILNQGDSRYNDTEAERILSEFILNNAVLIEKRDLPIMDKPSENDLINYFVQKEEKHIAKYLLKQYGFEDSEIYYEKEFFGYIPDVFAEKEGKIIIVECCSCKISKIIDFLSKIEEVWILTYGGNPWEEKPLIEKMQWFIFKKGKNWDNVYSTFRKQRTEELKKIKSPIDTLQNERKK